MTTWVVVLIDQETRQIVAAYYGKGDEADISARAVAEWIRMEGEEGRAADQAQLFPLTTLESAERLVALNKIVPGGVRLLP